MNSNQVLKIPHGIQSSIDVRLFRDKYMKDYLVKDQNEIQRNEDIVGKAPIKISLCYLCYHEDNKQLTHEYPWNVQYISELCEKHNTNIPCSIEKLNSIFDISCLLLTYDFHNESIDEIVKERYVIERNSQLAKTNRPFTHKKPSCTIILGNVGAGKSTLSKHLMNLGHHVVVEDIEKWTNSLSGNLLGQNPQCDKGSCLLQFFLIIDLLCKLDYKIVESGILGVLIHTFAKYLDGIVSLEELRIIVMACSSADFSRIKVIYVDTKPEVCLQRIKERNKSYDTHFTLARLCILDLLFKMMLRFVPHTKIDGTVSFETILSF